MRQSRPDSGLGLQVQVLITFQAAPFCLEAVVLSVAGKHHAQGRCYQEHHQHYHLMLGVYHVASIHLKFVLLLSYHHEEVEDGGVEVRG